MSSLTRRSIMRTAIWIAVVVLAWFAVRTLVRIDWGTAWSALAHLSGWQVAVLVVLAIVRIVLSSAPLAMLVDGLALRRAVANDLLGDFIATITPVPADIVARMAMFRSWRIDVTLGMSGLVLNSVLVYVLRLTVPLVGAILLWTVVHDDESVGVLAVVTASIGVAVVVVLSWGARSAASARRVGRMLGRATHRIRSSWPDADAIEQRAVGFHAQIGSRWRRRWLPSYVSLVAMALVEATILVLSLRFVGATSGEVGLWVIIAALLSVYLLVATPMRGLGLLEAAVAAIILDHSPLADPGTVVAGLVVWRVAIHLVPLLMGVAPVLVWRRSSAAAQAQAQSEGGVQVSP